jgi:hypothetical protein
VLINGQQKAASVWGRIENGKPIIVQEPSIFDLSSQDQGKTALFTLENLKAGDYAYVLGKVVGDQFQPVLGRRFRAQ